MRSTLNWMVPGAALAVLALATATRADVFSMGGTRNADGTWTGLASLEFVTVGNARNDADDTGYGKVDYDFQIGKYEVTNAQYIDFLNAVARWGDPHVLYTPGTGTSTGGIVRSGSGKLNDPYVYSVRGYP